MEFKERELAFEKQKAVFERQKTACEQHYRLALLDIQKKRESCSPIQTLGVPHPQGLASLRRLRRAR
jgi:hypothetical protein